MLPAEMRAEIAPIARALSKVADELKLHGDDLKGAGAFLGCSFDYGGGRPTGGIAYRSVEPFRVR